MYYPYLRGRQNELIALRELVMKGILSDKIIPIIEPVRLSSTLISTLKMFCEHDRKLVLIHNPSVGNFKKDSSNSKNIKLLQEYNASFNHNSLFNKGIIVSRESVETINSLYKDQFPVERIVNLCLNPDSVDCLLSSPYKDAVNIIPYSPAFRRIRENRVLIDDSFVKRERNADYLENEDEFFSNNHLYYSDEGYSGFSDYSVIGKEYNESGFAPYAVAIHIVYLDSNNEMRIHHFVSEDNEDIRDPAGKFYQALEKLVTWNKEKRIDTYGIKEFEKIYTQKTYPGLGYIKKLSIMHHLELIGKYLDGEL